MSDNVGFDNSIGWWMENSRNLTIHDNEFEHGLLMEGDSFSHWLHDISGNIVDGKPLGYIVNTSDTTIDCMDYAQVILVNCSGMTLTNGYFKGKSSAIELGFCRDCTIENISVYDPHSYGFYLEASDRCNLTGNRVVGTGFSAFRLDHSDNCTLTNNLASKGSVYGFYIYGLTGCTLSQNFADGPQWSYALFYSHRCNLVHNRAFHGRYGFNLGHANNCTLFNNTAMDNSEYGIYVNTAEYASIYLNRFAYNVVNAYDTGTDNEWDNGTHGNYWSDYGGVGTYTIPGSAGSVDNHPFAIISDPPEIDTPADIEYNFGSVGNQIVWHPNAEYPKSFRVYLNGMTWVSGTWNGSSIIVDVDGIAIDTFNFTILVADCEGRSVIDTVFVTVVEGTTTIITSTTTTITTTTTTTASGTTTTVTTTTTGTTTGPRDADTPMLLVISFIGAAVALLLLGSVRKRPR